MKIFRDCYFLGICLFISVSVSTGFPLADGENADGLQLNPETNELQSPNEDEVLPQIPEDLVQLGQVPEAPQQPDQLPAPEDMGVPSSDQPMLEQPQAGPELKPASDCPEVDGSEPCIELPSVGGDSPIKMEQLTVIRADDDSPQDIFHLAGKDEVEAPAPCCSEPSSAS